MEEMLRGLRQFIVQEQRRITQENEIRRAADLFLEMEPVPESFLDLMITDYVSLEPQNVGEFLAIDEDEHGDDSPRIVFIVLRNGEYSIEGTTLKTMMYDEYSNVLFQCDDYISKATTVENSEVLKINLGLDFGNKIYVPYGQIMQLIEAVQSKDERIFFAVPSGMSYNRSRSLGSIKEPFGFRDRMMCGAGSSIKLHNIFLCNDDVCSITRRPPPRMSPPGMAPPRIPPSGMAPPRISPPGIDPLRAQKRKRTIQSLIDRREKDIKHIEKLEAKQNKLTHKVEESVNDEVDGIPVEDILDRLESIDNELKYIKKKMLEDERRVKRKIEKER
jgi:hypothetical protein